MGINKNLQSYNVTTTDFVGICWMVTASFLLSVMFLLVNIIGNNIPVFQLLFLTNCFSFILVAGYMAIKDHSLFKASSLRVFFIRATISTLSIALWFKVLRLINLTDATAISYLIPLLNVLAAIIILKEVITVGKFIAVIIAFIGAMMVVKPVFSSLNVGYLLAIGSTFFWVISDIITKRYVSKDPILTQCFYILLFMTLWSLPLALYNWHQYLPKFNYSILAISILQLTNLITFLQAYKYGKMALIAPFDFTRLLFTLCISHYSFDETLSNSQILGIIIIFMTSSYLAITSKSILPIEKA